MLIFLTLALAGFLVLVVGPLLGHEHDHDGHFDHDVGHGHDLGHGEPSVSIFSLRVVGTFIMAFGSGGAIGRGYGYGMLESSLIGVGSGVALAGLLYILLRMLYSQQSDSLVATEQAVGAKGVVTVEIGPASVGSVEVMLAGQSRTYLARSADGAGIAKGREVTVVQTRGSELTVAPAAPSTAANH